MTPADLARQNAIPMEVKKDGLQQRQNGDWVLRFVVQAADMDERITRAAMGTRFMAALVEVGHDELPVQQPAKEPPTKSAAKLQPDTSDKPRPAGVGREKRDWRELPVSQQAGIRINEPTFAAYLREEHSPEWRETGDADACIKLMLGVNSKRDISNDHKALVLWRTIDTLYQVWLLKERVGA